MTNSTVAGALADFAATARIGRLRVGLGGTELTEALRGAGLAYDEALVERFDGREDSLEAHVEDGVLVQVGLDNLGDLTFRLPAPFGVAGRARVPMDALLAELDARGCGWRADPALSDAEQSAIRVRGGVSVVFAVTGDGHLTHSLYSTLGGPPG